MDTIDEGKSNRHVAVTSKISIPPDQLSPEPAGCGDNGGFVRRHERAQLQEPQHLPDQRQAGEHADRAEAQRETLPGGSGWKREGAGA